MAGRVTPEGRVKDKVKKVLNAYPDLYQHWPVQNGMGKPCLDAHCCYLGMYFSIETKAPGKKPTKRQEDTIAEIRAAGGKVFIIDGPDSLHPLKEWLDHGRAWQIATGGKRVGYSTTGQKEEH
jgi:hypothetical protein